MGREIESLKFRVEHWHTRNPGANNARLYKAFPGERKPSLRRAYNEIREVRREKELPPEPRQPGELLEYWGEDFFSTGEIDYEKMRRGKPIRGAEARNPLAREALETLTKDLRALNLSDEQKFATGVEIKFRDGGVRRFSVGSFRRFVRGSKGGAELIDYIRVIDTEEFEP